MGVSSPFWSDQRELQIELDERRLARNTSLASSFVSSESKSSSSGTNSSLNCIEDSARLRPSQARPDHSHSPRIS